MNKKELEQLIEKETRAIERLQYSIDKTTDQLNYHKDMLKHYLEKVKEQ